MNTCWKRGVGIAAALVVCMSVKSLFAIPPCKKHPEKEIHWTANQIEVSSQSEFVCGLRYAGQVRRVEIAEDTVGIGETRYGRWYLVKGPRDSIRAWKRTKGVSPEKRPDFEPGVRLRRIRLGSIVREFESAEENQCLKLPDVEAGATLLVASGSAFEVPVTPVVGRIDVRAEPFAPPPSPKFDTLRSESLEGACSEHGFFLAGPAVQRPPSVWTYRWEIRTRSGGLVQQGIGERPYAIGNRTTEEDEFYAPHLLEGTGEYRAYERGKTYTMHIRSVDWRGQYSDPIRLDFTFESTGEGASGLWTGVAMMLFIAPFLLGSAFVVGGLILTAGLLIRSR